MLPPATLAALHRLIAILIALIEAIAAPVDGVPRPFLTRLATRAFSAYLKRLIAQLDHAAADATPEPGAHTIPPEAPLPIVITGLDPVIVVAGLDPATRESKAGTAEPHPRPRRTSPVVARRRPPRAKITHSAPRLITPILLRYRN